MDTAQRKLKQAEQAVAAAEAAVEALRTQQTAAQKELPARSAEELTAQQTALTTARETLRSREKQLSAQLLPNRKTAAQYRAAAEARQTLESRWQWVSALAATAGTVRYTCAAGMFSVSGAGPRSANTAAPVSPAAFAASCQPASASCSQPGCCAAARRGRLKVLVLMASAPAARYARCTARMPSGSVRFACSHSCPGFAL